MRKLYVWLSGLLLVDVIAQFYFAGVGIFTFPGSPKDQFPKPEFVLHSSNWLVLMVLTIVTTIAAALAKAPGRTIGLTIVPLPLSILQLVIFFIAAAIFGDVNEAPQSVRFVIALHVLNALLILWTTVTIHRRARLHADAAADSAPRAESPADSAPAAASPAAGSERAEVTAG